MSTRYRNAFARAVADAARGCYLPTRLASVDGLADAGEQLGPMSSMPSAAAERVSAAISQMLGADGQSFNARNAVGVITLGDHGRVYHIGVSTRRGGTKTPRPDR
jgi:hypothetical protein